MTEEEKSNLYLWELHFETDPQYVKNVEYGARKFETVDAYYRIRLGTELWGPYGDKWGLKDQEIKIIGDHVLYKATFFCPESSFALYNDIKFATDFAKKIETDTLTKAMSKLGICGDVYMGKHADNKYVSELREKIYTENNKAILLYKMDKYKDSIEAIKVSIADGDLSTAAEAYIEIGLHNVEEFQDAMPLMIAPTKCKKVFGIDAPFTIEERKVFSSDEFKQCMKDFITKEIL